MLKDIKYNTDCKTCGGIGCTDCKQQSQPITTVPIEDAEKDDDGKVKAGE